jgi:hypothetical protein
MTSKQNSCLPPISIHYLAYDLTVERGLIAIANLSNVHYLWRFIRHFGSFGVSQIHFDIGFIKVLVIIIDNTISMNINKLIYM